MTATVNGLNAEWLDLVTPRIGAWSCDAALQSPDNPWSGLKGTLPSVGDRVTVAVDGFSWVGTVTSRDDRETGQSNVRVIGGAGKVGTAAPATFYGNGPTLQVIASQLLSATGEQLSQALSSPGLLASRFNGWQVLGDRTLAANLTKLAQAASAAWRIDPATGAVFFAIDAFSTSAALPTNARAVDALQGTGASYDCPSLDALPVPGTLDPSTGTPVQEVRVAVTQHDTRVELFYQQLSSFLPTPADAELGTAYACTVVSQAGDLTLTLRPDDAALGPSVSGAKIVALPGCSLNVFPGARCTLSFANGDPSQPVASFYAGNASDLSSMVLGSNPLPLAQAKFIDVFINAFTRATPVADDGGAAIQMAVVAALASAGWPPASTVGCQRLSSE